jgi:hypothetical protein
MIGNAGKPVIFGCEPEGKRQLGRPRHILEGNTKMDLRAIGWSYLDWIHLAQDRDQ